MYAHLQMKSVTPMIVTGYSLRSKIKFEYGDIIIIAECMVPEGATKGTVSLCLYRGDRAAGLPGGELPKYGAELSPDAAELTFLREIIPQNDITYILSLFGMRRPGDVYANRRRVRIETPSLRKHKYYERFELSFIQTVETPWLEVYGTHFGYRKPIKLP